MHAYNVFERTYIEHPPVSFAPIPNTCRSEDPEEVATEAKKMCFMQQKKKIHFRNAVKYLLPEG
jgi:hypothetical protein